MDNKLVVGVIGLRMGATHLKGVVAYGAEIGAICDTDPEKLRSVGEEFGVPEEKRFTDYRDVVADPRVNTVIIVTPDQLHRQMALDFLAAGKHVMCEKPLALIREDLDAIVAAAEASDRKFMVGQICRFTPAFEKAKEIIDSGAIGELYFVESEYAHDYMKILVGENNWRLDPQRHGVVGGGCHAVDLLRWFAGDPEEVFAYGTHKLLPLVLEEDGVIRLKISSKPGYCWKLNYLFLNVVKGY